MVIDDNLISLHIGEETLRTEALRRISGKPLLLLHFEVTAAAMDLLDVFRQYPTNDEDTKVKQALGIRLFNAHAAAIKLMLSGYYQNATMVLRDVLETIFLADYFRTSPAEVERWRMADKKTLLRDFKPAIIRGKLDARDGVTTKKRGDAYALFSGLAGHASMEGFAMLRPLGKDMHTGPFLDNSALEAVAAEMGKLSVQVGEIFSAFTPLDWGLGRDTAAAFAPLKMKWLKATGFIK
ncbi:MAG: hypothetical protein WCC66_02705 [Rhizobiaceae bacterium]